MIVFSYVRNPGLLDHREVAIEIRNIEKRKWYGKKYKPYLWITPEIVRALGAHPNQHGSGSEVDNLIYNRLFARCGLRIHVDPA